MDVAAEFGNLCSPFTHSSYSDSTFKRVPKWPISWTVLAMSVILASLALSSSSLALGPGRNLKLFSNCETVTEREPSSPIKVLGLGISDCLLNLLTRSASGQQTRKPGRGPASGWRCSRSIAGERPFQPECRITRVLSVRTKRPGC